MLRVLCAFVVALITAAVLYTGLGLYSWTAIHSGWSIFAIRMYFVAMWVVPLAMGVLTGVCSYGWLTGRRGR